MVVVALVPVVVVVVASALDVAAGYKSPSHNDNAIGIRCFLPLTTTCCTWRLPMLARHACSWALVAAKHFDEKIGHE